MHNVHVNTLLNMTNKARDIAYFLRKLGLDPQECQTENTPHGFSFIYRNLYRSIYL